MAKFRYLAGRGSGGGYHRHVGLDSFLPTPNSRALSRACGPRAKASGISRDVFDRAFAGITEPDPTVLKLANDQPEFTSTTSQYLGKAVTQIRIDSGQSMKSSRGGSAVGDREALQGRSRSAPRHLGHGKQFRQGQGADERHALARHLALFRPPQGLCAQPVYRGAEDPAERHRLGGQFHRLLGRRHGPHAIRADLLSLLRRRLDRRWQEGHLEFEPGRARLDG